MPIIRLIIAVMTNEYWLAVLVLLVVASQSFEEVSCLESDFAVTALDHRQLAEAGYSSSPGDIVAKSLFFRPAFWSTGTIRVVVAILNCVMRTMRCPTRILYG